MFMSNVAAEKIGNTLLEGPFEPQKTLSEQDFGTSFGVDDLMAQCNEALQAGELDQLEELSQADEQPEINENQGISANRNTLEQAIDAGDVETIKRILQTGLDLNKMNGEDGLTPLEVAIAVNNYSDEILALLLENGASPNLQSDGGLSALHLVAGYMHSSSAGDARTQTARLLVKHGAETELRNDQGMTPLAQAINGGNTDEAIALMMVGADPNTDFSTMMDRSDNRPVLSWAISSPAHVDALLDFGADPLAKASDGRTALELIDEKVEELNATKVGLIQSFLGKGKARVQEIELLSQSRELIVEASIF
jgi:ankyrin repeat protein